MGSVEAIEPLEPEVEHLSLDSSIYLPYNPVFYPVHVGYFEISSPHLLEIVSLGFIDAFPCHFTEQSLQMRLPLKVLEPLVEDV